MMGIEFRYQVPLDKINGFDRNAGHLLPAFEEHLRQGMSRSPFNYLVHVLPDNAEPLLKSSKETPWWPAGLINVLIGKTAFNALFSFYLAQVQWEQSNRRKYEGPEAVPEFTDLVTTALVDLIFPSG